MVGLYGGVRWVFIMSICIMGLGNYHLLELHGLVLFNNVFRKLLVQNISKLPNDKSDPLKALLPRLILLLCFIEFLLVLLNYCWVWISLLLHGLSEGLPLLLYN
jgi:uncharacterized membrane protein